MSVARPALLRSPALLTVCALVVFTATTFHVPVKTERGFAHAAKTMLAHGLPENATALVSSDPIGEGAFVAQVATLEARPSRIVLRASKLLAAGTWMGANYAVKYETDSALLDALDRARVEYVALDDGSDEPHHTTTYCVTPSSDRHSGR